MVELGKAAGVKTSALLTDMSTPGLTVGNALEVRESVEVRPVRTRRCRRPHRGWQEMLRLAGKTDVDVRAALKTGRAMDKWSR